MSLTEEIENAKAKIAALETSLSSQIISKQELNDIRLQIVATQNFLTELYKLNSSTGEKYSNA